MYSSSSAGFEGKVVLVTGAGSGIGREGREFSLRGAPSTTVPGIPSRA
jgi:NADP-dependent 3-hydroxy acid dehydrogenase YdfG